MAGIADIVINGTQEKIEAIYLRMRYFTKILLGGRVLLGRAGDENKGANQEIAD